MPRYQHIVWIFCAVFGLSSCANSRVTWEEAMQQQLDRCSVYSDQMLLPYFNHSHCAYPPDELAFLIFKNTGLLELYAKSDSENAWHFIRYYHVYAASGRVGPKLERGDKQVPEGIYHVDGLNPRSRFNLSIRLDYPNSFDQLHALVDQRDNLGSDIFIHGGARSVGCIAIGNKNIDQLFPLVEKVGRKNVVVVIAPSDFRLHIPALINPSPDWLPELYSLLSQELSQFPLPPHLTVAKY